MKIAVIGSGHIGAGLAKAWADKSQVTFGARDPGQTKLALLCKEINASAASTSSAVEGAEVVAFAMPYGAIDSVLQATGALVDKIVIDCTNAVERGPEGMSLKFGHTTSAAEELQKRIPRAKVFKSFNAQGAENLANPVYHGVKASNFFCGDDPEARKIVRQLVEKVGFDAVDAGGLKSARLLEPLMLLWISTAQAIGSRDIAFSLLQR
jgi:8-hydroxy-5-deazaflavin:NADPH oxidoreductase